MWNKDGWILLCKIKKYRGSLIVDYGGHRSAAQNAQMEAATNVNQRVAAYRVPAYKHHGTALSYFFL